MFVLVRKDSATNVPVEIGEGKEAVAKLRGLVEEHGLASISMADGTDVSATPGNGDPEPKPKSKKGEK